MYSIKVGDFGLSRETQSGEYYKASAKMFPFKWTAPEAIKYWKFSTKSDMWSFGVTLWEICTDGELPYACFENGEILKQLESGYRLPKPKSCLDELYNIMLDCWKTNADQRPQWTAVYQRLKNLLETIDKPVEKKTVDKTLSQSLVIDGDGYGYKIDDQINYVENKQ